MGFWGILLYGQTSIEKHRKKLCQACGVLAVRKKKPQPTPQTPSMRRLEVRSWAKLRGCLWGGKGKEWSVSGFHGYFSVLSKEFVSFCQA